MRNGNDGRRNLVPALQTLFLGVDESATKLAEAAALVRDAIVALQRAARGAASLLGAGSAPAAARPRRAIRQPTLPVETISELDAKRAENGLARMGCANIGRREP